ncbi:helix-turn-helix domain-containing protein [Ciceribacter selenitireducens]
MSEFRVTNAVFADASEQEGGLAGWSQRYSQLRPGRYQGTLQTLQFDGVSISRERVEVAVEEATCPPGGSLVFLHSLAQRNAWRVNAVCLGSSEVSVLKGGHEVHAALDEGSDVLITMVDAARLGDIAAPQSSVTTAQKLPEAEAVMGWFLTLMAAFATEASCPGDDLARFLPELICDKLSFLYAAIMRREGSGRTPSVHDYALYRRAREVVEDQPNEPMSVTTLAKRLAVPAELLRFAFVETVGIGPGAWLRQKRLDGARRDLLAARRSGIGVSDVAMKWGFWHLGRFSAYYAELYGETPSQTLGRSG